MQELLCCYMWTAWQKGTVKPNKYIFINSSVAENRLHNLKVYEGKETIISFLSIQILLQSLHHLLHADSVKPTKYQHKFLSNIHMMRAQQLHFRKL
jgi:hypothetical protein